MLQWENLHKNMVKFDLLTDGYTLSVLMDQGGFLKDYTAQRLVRHCHGHFEVQYQCSTRNPAAGRFFLTPPGIWHTGIMQPPGETAKVTTFCFGLQDRNRQADEVRHTHGILLERFLQMEKIFTAEDTFGGGDLIRAVQEELQQPEICYEQIHALLYLLMVKLARLLPQRETSPQPPVPYRSEDFLPERVEIFLSYTYGNTDCSRAQMAKHLKVSERQLGRILEMYYHKSFRELLLAWRMENAEAWRLSDELAAAEAARRVGYTSVRGFCNAYEKYHGKKYLEP